MSSKLVVLNANFKGFVSVVVNAYYEQQVFLEVKTTDGVQIATAIFQGRGVRVHATNISSRRGHYSFGPFKHNVDLFVTIRHKHHGIWFQSKMVGPLSIIKKPEPDFPMEFLISTIASEDSEPRDSSHDDCTVDVLQYKSDSESE